MYQNQFDKKIRNSYQTADYINKLITDCVQFGTIPFAIAARHGLSQSHFYGQQLIKKLFLPLE
jgi:hypothetical protein